MELQQVYKSIFGEDIKTLMFFPEDSEVIIIQKPTGRIFDWLDDRTKTLTFHKFETLLNNAIKVLKNSYNIRIQTKQYSDGTWSSTVYGIGISGTMYISDYKVMSRFNAYKSAYLIAQKQKEN